MDLVSRAAHHRDAGDLVRVRVRVRLGLGLGLVVRVRVRVRVSDAGHQRLHPVIAAGVVEVVVRCQHLSTARCKRVSS